MSDRYAVMGNPIAHSKSPFIHSQFAQQTGESLLYEAIWVPPGTFAEAVAAFQAAGGLGLNVTLPYKEEAFALADVRTSRAEQAVAANTLWFASDGQRYGDNTDGIGLVRDLCENHGISLNEKHILLLGAGGATRGVIGPLLEARPRQIVCANRTESRAHALMAHFANQGPVAARSFSQLAGLQFELIINATSASLKGESLSLPEGSYALEVSAMTWPMARNQLALCAGGKRRVRQSRWMAWACWSSRLQNPFIAGVACGRRRRRLFRRFA